MSYLATNHDLTFALRLSLDAIQSTRDTRFVVDVAAGKLWRDGDDWSRNNYNRCVASWLPLTEADKVVATCKRRGRRLPDPTSAGTA